MKRVLSVICLLGLVVVGVGVVMARGPEAAGSSGGETFVHVATAENTAADATLIDHPQTNGNPNAILLVTQNWNPGGSEEGIINDHEVGVFYSLPDEKWGIYNEDNTDMPLGAAFNVLIPHTASYTLVHTSSDDNVFNNWTEIDNIASNDNPGAIVFTTHNFRAGGGEGDWHDHSLGVWYAKSGHWSIFNQDIAAMETGIDFNVHIAPPDPTVFVHTAEESNIFDNWTYLDHPLANGNSAAHLIVTQNWSVNGVYNDKAIGVWYYDDEGRWAIFNQDDSDMPLGAAFNVKVSSRQTFLPMIPNDGLNVSQR